jgi:hypothetical protein
LQNGNWFKADWLMVFTFGGIANNLMFLEFAHKRQTTMTKLSKLYQAWLKIQATKRPIN